MANSKIRIKDTGLDKVGGTVTYTKVNSGSWTDLEGFILRGEFTVNSTDNQANRSDSSDSSFLDFKSNEVAAILSPRFTLQGLVAASNSTLIQNIVKFGRSKGVKRVTGGLGLIAALPEAGTDTYEYVDILIKNITFSEIVAQGDEYINFTIQVEQVN